MSEEDKAALDEDYQVLTGLFGVMNGMVSEYEGELQDYVYVGGPNASPENDGTSAEAPTTDMWKAMDHMKDGGKIVVCGISTEPLYHFGAEGGGGIIRRDLYFTNTDGVNTYDDAKLILNDYVYMEANITFEHMEIEAIRRNYGGYCFMLSDSNGGESSELVVEINLNDIKMAKHTYVRKEDGIEITEDTYLMVGNMTTKSATVNVTDCDFGMNAVDHANNLTLNLTRASVVSTPGSDQPIGDVSLKEESTLVTRQVLRSVTADRSQNMLKGYNETVMSILGEVTIDGIPIKLAPSDRISLGADLTLVQSTEENASLTADKFTVDAPYTLVKRENQITTDHTYADTWTADAVGHWHAATCAHSTERADYAKHSGGTATCHTQAICSVCQTAYGKFDKTKHDGKTEVRGVREPNYESEGYTGDTYCLGCGEKIASGTTIPKLDDNKNQWKQDSNGWKYQTAYGSFVKNDWKLVNGKWYHFGTDGYMQTGWILVNSKWYYMNESGAMLTGWIKVGGTWYYLSESGAMVTGWKLINNKWYYMNPSGAMTTGWQLVNGQWYYMDGSGAMTTGWQLIGGTWYYMNRSGAMLTGWINLGGTWYLLSGSGAMLTDWQLVNGVWYYMYGSGAMAANTWIGRYYVNGSGAWVSTR
ncbi:MAG: N-acetylmuramoyl-L-alanine amidase family protein [Clostridia bacterium]|nr:N-acetylmuramoyl-L-alanine amidase family protein [Clostridia bacterium]